MWVFLNPLLPQIDGITGAGHPGEEDIGGLVLVSASLAEIWAISELETACPSSTGAKHTIYFFWWDCRRTRTCSITITWRGGK